jgi:filamentous hemagglutinin
MGTTATLTIAGGVAAGAISGVVGGVILTGTLRGAIQGGAVGALTGGIASYYGDVYSVKRIAAETISGGASAEIYGQDFKDGLKLAFAVSVLNYSNYKMRTAERNLSNEHPMNRNTNGESAGFYGDGTKMAGAREQFDSFGNRLPCVSPAGGCQGAPVGPFDQRSNFFGTSYSPGGVKDYLNESFAGPHDWFRNNVSRSYIRSPSGAYDIIGNMKNLSGVRLQFDRFANAALIPLAAPFAVAGMLATQTSMYALAMQYLHTE